jgi:MOSC domain-containing protein YiiM
MDELAVRDVFVGRPSLLGHRRDTPVYSAIAKARVGVGSLELTELNLEGDQQADLSVHGGPDKAVYVYPAEHYQGWSTDSFSLGPGGVGENVSLSGAEEDTVRIGDVWAWGNALLEVSQPRTPCFKLAMRTGRKDVIPAMIDSGRTGWYLRVLRPGRVPTSGAMTLVERDPASPTVKDMCVISFANVARLDATQREAYLRLAERAVSMPKLSAQYRARLLAKLGRRSSKGAP